MPHAPFIIGAYSIAAVLMTWCALAPVFHARKLRRNILNRMKHLEGKNASNP